MPGIYYVAVYAVFGVTLESVYPNIPALFVLLAVAGGLVALCVHRRAPVWLRYAGIPSTTLAAAILWEAAVPGEEIVRTALYLKAVTIFVWLGARLIFNPRRSE